MGSGQKRLESIALLVALALYAATAILSWIRGTP
jgi:hypothetical protein